MKMSDPGGSENGTFSAPRGRVPGGLWGLDDHYPTREEPGGWSPGASSMAAASGDSRETVGGDGPGARPPASDDRPLGPVSLRLSPAGRVATGRAPPIAGLTG